MKTSFIRTVGALALSMATVSGASAEEPLRVGISAEPYPPFTYKSSSGDWTGFEVELAFALCDAMEASCEITPTDWNGIIPSLKSGKIDMIMNSMTITEERDKVIDFTDPYYASPEIYVGAKSLDFSGEEDLSGKILAVQSSTIHAAYVRETLKDSGATTRIYDQFVQMTRDLQAGRIDVFLADQVGTVDFLSSEEGQDYEAKAQTPNHPIFGKGAGIGLREDDDDLQKALNGAIEQVLSDGTCAAISEKYFDGDDICGA